MKKETVKATAILKEGTIVEATSGGFKMNFDEPLKSGGTDTAMNPVQGLLCALGSCQALSAYYGAKMYGIELKGFSIDVEGDFDEEGQHGENGVNSGFTDVRITYNFDASNSEEDLKKFVKFIEATCPVGDTIANKVNIGMKAIVRK